MKTQQFFQHPGESKSYQQQIVNDTITSAVWSITPTGPTLSPYPTTANAATVLVSGLTLGENYTLMVTLDCGSGQIFTPSAVLECV